MTLDDLRTINNCAYHKFLNDIEGREDQFPDAIVEAERAGIRAVVEALRDEMSGNWIDCSHCDTNDKLFREILASDGVEKAAGGSTREGERGDGTTGATSAVAVTAPAAAPVCEWKFDGKGWIACSCGGRGRSDPGIWHLMTTQTDPAACRFCGEPIRFKPEAAR